MIQENDAVPGIHDLEDDEFAAMMIERARAAHDAGMRMARERAFNILFFHFSYVELSDSGPIFALSPDTGRHVLNKKGADEDIADAIAWLTFNTSTTYDPETKRITLGD